MTTPRDEPQRQPCRCETCKNLDVTGSDDSCPNEEYCGKTGCIITESIKIFIEVHGCFSHSANTGTQTRIDAVVKILGSARRAETTEQIDEFIDEAIALLKEGVGK
jgi:transcription initiation factor TFIIIB Brf1 subunit/transcription initiation factor TFIIB